MLILTWVQYGHGGQRIVDTTFILESVYVISQCNLATYPYVQLTETFWGLSLVKAVNVKLC